MTTKLHPSFREAKFRWPRSHDCPAALLIGCNLRKELPLVALRFRQLVRNGGRVAALNPIRFDSNFSLATEWVIAPREMRVALAGVAQQLAKERKVEFPAEIEALVRPDLDIETAREHRAAFDA